MSSNDLYLNKLVFASRKHILDMLSDRGFDTKILENYTQEETTQMLEKHQQGKYEGLTTLSPLDIKLKKSDGSIIIIKYRLDEKIKKDILLKQIMAIHESHKLTGDNDCIIIMNTNRVILKPGVKDDSVVGLVNLCYLKGVFAQIYGLENFMFNISKHAFQPKFTVLTAKEITDLTVNLNVKLENLPRIKREDPMAKYIGLHPKQVVKIDAINATTGTSITYRVCIRE